MIKNGKPKYNILIDVLYCLFYTFSSFAGKFEGLLVIESMNNKITKKNQRYFTKYIGLNCFEYTEYTLIW